MDHRNFRRAPGPVGDRHQKREILVMNAKVRS
jgi:hypothetical protein